MLIGRVVLASFSLLTSLKSEVKSLPLWVVHKYVLNDAILDCFGGENEKRLYRDMLEGYETLARPVQNESEAVVVSLGISLQQLVDIDEKNQVIILNVWLNYVSLYAHAKVIQRLDKSTLLQQWNDNNFKWNPVEYGGVKEIRLPPDKIWKPDVLLYNSADESFDSTYPSNVVVRSNGAMEWIPPGIIKGTCKIDIQWFPFDDQKCSLKFGSWTFDGSMLDLKVGEVNNATYTPNGEWDLIDVTSIRNEKKYDCCPEPYYDVTFTVWVRRRTLYYGFNLIIPCLLISFMTLLDFTLPPDSGEKLSLGVTIFMSLCVFLLMVAEALPPTSDAVPLIGTYFSSIMIVVSASVVFTVLVLNIHHRNPTSHEMGNFMRTVFLNWLPWLLMMKRPGFVSRRGKFRLKNDPADDGVVPKSTSKSLLANILDIDSEKKSPCDCVNLNPVNHYLTNGDLKLSDANRNAVSQLQYAVILRLEPLLSGIYTEIQQLTAKLKHDDDEDEVINDWKFAAMVVDRLSLIIFTSVLVVSTCAIIFAAPHIF